MLEGLKNLLLCMFFHEQRYKKTSLEKEEATLVRLVALNIHHNQIQVLSTVNSLPCIQQHSCVAFDNGGGAITAISTPVGVSTLVGTDHTYFAIAMLLTSSRILS